MKTTRRGLGSLLAGAVAATQAPYDPRETTAKAYDTLMPESPQERLKYLLGKRELHYLDHYTKRDRYAEEREGDVDVLALKSCSPAGRDVIFRTRQAKQRTRGYSDQIKYEIEELLKHNPLLWALI